MAAACLPAWHPESWNITSLPYSLEILHGLTLIPLNDGQIPGILQSFRARGALAAPIQNRALSLSNLLDVGIVDLDEMRSLGGGDKEDAFESESQAASVAKRKAKSVPQWKRKQNVIEAVNELIDELDNILQSITIQGVEHIHAKEVGI